MYSGIARLVEASDLFHVTTDLEVLTPFVHYCDIIDSFLVMFVNLQKVTVSKCDIHAMPILFICVIVLQIFSDYTF